MVAQDAGSSSSSAQAGSSAGQVATQDHVGSAGSSDGTVTGCLNGSPTSGTYTLTDGQTGTTYNLTGHVSDLGHHVGEQVQLTGHAMKGGSTTATGSGANPSDQSASSGSSAAVNSGGSHQTDASSGASSGSSFEVTGVTKISDHCSGR